MRGFLGLGCPVTTEEVIRLSGVALQLVELVESVQRIETIEAAARAQTKRSILRLPAESIVTSATVAA